MKGMALNSTFLQNKKTVSLLVEISMCQLFMIFFFEPFFSLEHSVFLFPVSGILFED